ncbi:MAG: ATP-binding protein [Melioribacter sp.]|nr:ATP-binding protein [Melioribacter sp.]
MALVQKSSLNDFLVETQSWYQKYSAERLAIITSTSMELLYENLFMDKPHNEYDERRITYSFNVIFKQQLIQKSVEDISLILIRNHRLYVIDSGQKLYKFLTNTLTPYDPKRDAHIEAVNQFLSVKDKMQASEIIHTTLVNNKTFNILVPFVPDGEYLGVMYMKITPDFSFLTREVRANYDKVALIYTSLIFIGLIIIFIVSSQAVKERNEALQKFYEEHQENIKKQIRLEKESLFTKRIYHTHHKAEKIIGFIKEDVRKMDAPGIEELKKRVITYSNFISRIIYDMKWYDQDINTIVNPMFRTNVNEVIKFIVDNVFLRISSKNEMFNFKLELDDRLPLVNVNEFVIWEILEPLIQNSIDHGNKKFITIKIITKYNPEKNISYIIIEDDGVGIKEELLETGENGIKRIFLENESTKKVEGANSGYGCYIAYQMAVEKCGWEIDAINLDEGGCRFILTINNNYGG